MCSWCLMNPDTLKSFPVSPKLTHAGQAADGSETESEVTVGEAEGVRDTPLGPAPLTGTGPSAEEGPAMAAMAGAA